MEEVASTAVGGGLGRGERERRGLSCRAGWMFAKLPGCRPRSKVVKAVGDGVGIGVGGFVGGHGEKLWVEFSRGCRWSSEEDQLPRSFLVLLLLQLPLLQGRWERGVEEGVANRYGRGRVCGSGGGGHRGRLRLFGSWVSLFNGLWSHACSASATFPDCIHPWHDVYLPTHPTLIAGEGL